MNSIVKASIVSLVLLLVFGLGIYFLLIRSKNEPAPAGDVVVEQPTEKASAKTVEPTKATTKINTAELKPPEGAVSLVVRVLDAATKKLLPRATLVVQKVTDGDRPGERVFESGRVQGAAASGEFQVPIPAGVYQVKAQCPSYSSRNERVTVTKDRSNVMVLELGRGNSISGRILTMDKRGIGGAKVYAYHEIGDPHANQIERLLNIIDLPKQAGEAPAEAVSAADGSYQLDGLEKKYYSVKAIAASFSPGEKPHILPTKEGVDIQLQKGGDLSGVVVESGGTGVEGAKVMAYIHVDSSDIFQIIETRSRPPMDTVTTGPGGQFRFETLGAGVYNFIVAAKGYQDGKFLKIKVREGENAGQRFVVNRGLTIAGTVLSQTGEPIATAKVRATRQGDTGRSDNLFITFSDGSISTDAKGKFAFDTLEPGKYTVLAWHHDYATEQMRDVEAGTDSLSITLPTGGAIAGLITEAGTGNPVAGARVSVSDTQDLRKEGVTDDKGNYYIGGLNAASQAKRYVNVQADGYARLNNVQVFVEDNKLNEKQNFELARTALVEGRVVDKNGQGVAKVRLMAKKKNEKAGVPMTVGSGESENNGQFQIRDLEGGEGIEIAVLGGDYLDASSAPFSVAAGESITIPDIVLSLGGVVEGMVLDASGKGIGGVQVTVREEGKTSDNLALSASSDDRGKFILKGLPTGEVELVAKSIHHLEEVVSGVKVSEGLTTRDVKFVLKQGAHVKGVILDGDGQPVRGAQVLARDVSPSGMKELRAESEQDGTFSVENILATDAIEIEIEHPDYGSWANEKVPVNTENLKVGMAKLGGVRAVVVDPNGKPVSSFTVQPSPKGQASEDARKRLGPKTFGTSTDGSFQYDGIPAGVYTINIRSPNYAVFTFDDVQVGTKVTDLGRAVLQEGGALAGVVVDHDGQPVNGATVRVLGGLVRFNNPTSSGAGRSPGDQSVVVTDSTGAFQFKNLKGGPVSLQVNSKGFVPVKVENIDLNNPAQALNVKAILEVGAEIFGTAIDGQNNVKSGVSVFLTGDRPDWNQRTSTDSEGKFQFKGLSPGRYRVAAQKVGELGVNPVDLVVNPGDQQEVELVFE
jgi:uncharacterized GH25 family protein